LEGVVSSHVGGFGGKPVPDGAPQQTMPQPIGSAPVLNVKSGVMPPVAPVPVAMIQRAPDVPFERSLGTSSTIPLKLPSQFHADSRLCATKVWLLKSVRISTKPPPSSMVACSSSITAKWKAAWAAGIWSSRTTTSSERRNMARTSWSV